MLAPMPDFPWTVRVAAAFLLAALLQMSDGSVFWSELVPSLLTCGAVLVIAWQLLVVRHRRA
jgi:hypothetical protein